MLVELAVTLQDIHFDYLVEVNQLLRNLSFNREHFRCFNVTWITHHHAAETVMKIGEMNNLIRD